MTIPIHKTLRKDPAQIRLLIPHQMLNELNALAKSRLITRLALIRFYLRKMIDKELSELSAHFQQQEKNRTTCSKINEYFQDRDE